MQDFLLLTVVLTTFVFGWFLMRKLDIFLEENREEEDRQTETDEKVLRK